MAQVPQHLKPKVTDLLQKVERLLKQQPQDSHKLYSLHAPEVECINKGKSRQPYEFGVKVSVMTTHRRVGGRHAQPAGQSLRSSNLRKCS